MTKITALAATFAILVSTRAHAQERERRIEVVGFGGVGFTGDLGVSSNTQAGTETGNVSFDAAPVYGGMVGFRAQPKGFAYLSYSRMEMTAYFRPSGGFDSTAQAKVTFDYFQIGGNLEGASGRVVPYLGLSLGATRLAPVDGSGNDFSFSGVLDGGIKLNLADFSGRASDRQNACQLHQRRKPRRCASVGPAVRFVTPDSHSSKVRRCWASAFISIVVRIRRSAGRAQSYAPRSGRRAR